MKAVFYKKDETTYQQVVDYVRSCGNLLYFYNGKWEHYTMVYDISRGSLKIYNEKTSIDCYREVTGIYKLVII